MKGSEKKGRKVALLTLSVSIFALSVSAHGASFEFPSHTESWVGLIPLLASIAFMFGRKRTS